MPRVIEAHIDHSASLPMLRTVFTEVCTITGERSATAASGTPSSVRSLNTLMAGTPEPSVKAGRRMFLRLVMVIISILQSGWRGFVRCGGMMRRARRRLGNRPDSVDTWWGGGGQASGAVEIPGRDRADHRGGEARGGDVAEARVVEARYVGLDLAGDSAAGASAIADDLGRGVGEGSHRLGGDRDLEGHGLHDGACEMRFTVPPFQSQPGTTHPRAARCGLPAEVGDEDRAVRSDANLGG